MYRYRGYSVNIRIGQDHERRVTEDDGTTTYRSTRAVYGRNHNILGYIRKPWVRRGGWWAYDISGRSIGAFTTRDNAIDAVVEARL